MDLEELKERFRSKAVADLKDIDTALKATPYLVRQVMRLEEELDAAEARIAHLSGMLRRRPPTRREGQKNKAAWWMEVDEKRNRLFVSLKGTLDKAAAKLVVNSLLAIVPNLREGFAVITDIRELDYAGIDARIRFYFRKAHYTFANLKVSHVVRVVGEEKKVPNFLFEDPQDMGKTGVPKIHMVRSPKEAALLLDTLGRHLKQ